MPRPGTPVVHPGMLAQVRGVAAGAHLSTCELLRPAASTDRVINPETLEYSSPDPTSLWTGRCRVQPQSRSGAQPVDAAGEQLVRADYQVTVPISAPLVLVDDLVRIVSSSDPQATGRVLRIVDVAVGDLQGERQLACEDDQR